MSPIIGVNMNLYFVANVDASFRSSMECLVVCRSLIATKLASLAEAEKCSNDLQFPLIKIRLINLLVGEVRRSLTTAARSVCLSEQNNISTYFSLSVTLLLV